MTQVLHILNLKTTVLPEIMCWCRNYTDTSRTQYWFYSVRDWIVLLTIHLLDTSVNLQNFKDPISCISYVFILYHCQSLYRQHMFLQGIFPYLELGRVFALTYYRVYLKRPTGSSFTLVFIPSPSWHPELSYLPIIELRWCLYYCIQYCFADDLFHHWNLISRSKSRQHTFFPSSFWLLVMDWFQNCPMTRSSWYSFHGGSSWTNLLTAHP